MRVARTPIRPPDRGDLLREIQVAGDLGRLLLEAPDLLRQPKGDGAPVVVLPGFGGSDLSTALLRAYLRYQDHDARGWSLGRNLGDVAALVPKVVAVVSAVREETGRPVALIGWSLGGVLAREAARRAKTIYLPTGETERQQQHPRETARPPPPTTTTPRRAGQTASAPRRRERAPTFSSKLWNEKGSPSRSGTRGGPLSRSTRP